MPEAGLKIHELQFLLDKWTKSFYFFPHLSLGSVPVSGMLSCWFVFGSLDLAGSSSQA